MKNLKWILILSLFVFSTNSYGKKFVYCSEASPSAFNPQITTDGTSNNAAAHTIYERLVDFKEGTTELEPALAKSWTISKDGLVYTFNLRDNVHFHTTKYFKPTRKMNADDVVFSFNRMMDKNHPYNKVGGGKYEQFYSSATDQVVKSIKKISDYQVVFTLNKPNSPFLANIATSFMSVLSKEYGDQLAKLGKKQNIDQKPIGTGPFVFKKYIKDTLIRYKRNEKYWGQKAKSKHLIFAITPDSSVRAQKLLAGECHLVSQPSPTDLKNLEGKKGIKVISDEGLNVGYLAMNTQKKPLNNVKVRKAISHALNKASYIKAIYQNRAKVATHPIPPNQWSYNKKVKGDDYNPELSRKLLKEAGFEKGLDLELWTLPVSRPYNPSGKKMGELMQADLAKVGIKIKLVTYDWPTYLKKSSNGEHTLIQIGWSGDTGDPDNYFYPLLGCQGLKAGSNLSRWCYKPFDDLIEKARVITAQSKRTKLYEKAQVIFQKQIPWIPIANAKVYRAMSEQVQGYTIDPLGADIFKKVFVQ